jgi:hypothetical protein
LTDTTDTTPVISATGLFTPSETITNAELVASFNAYVENHNRDHADAIASNAVTALLPLLGKRNHRRINTHPS